MQLEAQGRKAGIAIMSLLALALVVVSAGIWLIRVGGPVDARQQRIADLTADILPPPLYVIEPYLEAGALLRDPGSLAARKASLADLQSQYAARQAFWAASDLPDGLKQDLATQVAASSDGFWRELDERFLPAIQSGDRAASNASFTRLTALYGAHRSAVDALVARTARVQQEIEQESRWIVYGAIALLAVIAGLLATGVALGLGRMMSRALRPLSQTARIMTAMAEGDLDAGRCALHREDEIGAMTRAIEVFRKVSEDRRRVARHQQEVVDTLSAALDELARGDLSRTIDASLGAEYEALRAAYNKALGLLSGLIAGVSNAVDSVSSGS